MKTRSLQYYSEESVHYKHGSKDNRLKGHCHVVLVQGSLQKSSKVARTCAMIRVWGQTMHRCWLFPPTMWVELSYGDQVLWLGDKHILTAPGRLRKWQGPASELGLFLSLGCDAAVLRDTVGDPFFPRHLLLVFPETRLSPREGSGSKLLKHLEIFT